MTISPVHGLTTLVSAAPGWRQLSTYSLDPSFVGVTLAGTSKPPMNRITSLVVMSTTDTELSFVSRLVEYARFSTFSG